MWLWIADTQDTEVVKKWACEAVKNLDVWVDVDDIFQDKYGLESNISALKTWVSGVLLYCERDKLIAPHLIENHDLNIEVRRCEGIGPQYHALKIDDIAACVK